MKQLGVITICVLLALHGTPKAELTFEQRWEPVRQIPQPRELTFEERWAPVRQLPQMIDMSTMPPPPTENRTAQIDSSLFDPKPILSETEQDGIPFAPIRTIRVRVEHKPVSAFLFDKQPILSQEDADKIARIQAAIIAPETAPVATAAPFPALRPVANPPPHKRVASIRRTGPLDICQRHGMHKEITRGGKSWRCRR
jgi:hypothetical protein